MSSLKSIILESKACTVVHDPTINIGNIRFDVVCDTKQYQCLYFVRAGSETVQVYSIEQDCRLGYFGYVFENLSRHGYDCYDIMAIESVMNQIKLPKLCSFM